MPAVLAAAAVASLAYGVYSGENQKKVAKKGLRLQDQAQQDAQDAAIRDATLAEEETNRARQKTPDLNVLLADQMKPKASQSAIDADRLLLGRPGLLGA
ncbi:MAG: hypothetical protein RJA36_804 [Pseudomonadota bacterium]|jgi:type II secretory pathway pseudopilin PulG